MALSFSVLQSRDFRILLLTRIFGTMAMQAQAVIVGWQIYSITKSPFILGLTGLAEAIPALVCALIAGHIVDTSRPYKVFVLCIATLTLNMLFLYLVAGGIVSVPGDNLVPWIFAGVIVSGIARSFIMPSSFVLQPQIVPRDHIASSSAWLSGGFQLGVITGPAIAGIIYGGYGVQIAWLIPVTLMSVELFLVCSMSKPHRHFRTQHKREPAIASIKAGWRFIFHNQILLSVMALDMFAVLFGGAVAMLPAVADQILHIGSEGLGALRAAPALGAIVSALILATRPMKHIHATHLLYVIAGFGLCMIGFGISQSFWLSMLFLIASGAFDSVSMVIRQTLMQWLIPDAMRGRVSAVNSMFIISSNEIGAFESGLAARCLGLTPSIIFGGIATLFIVALTATLSSKLRRLIVSADKPATSS